MRAPLGLLCLILAVFFGRSFYVGLSPDAALYAGLSLRVLESGEFWRLSATDGFFPAFFEHPPFFFQWGALVLSVFGESDGAARAIGAIPGALAAFSLVFWVLKRFGYLKAFVLTLMLLSFGHFTKYAATSQMEASLSLGCIWALIATTEYFYSLKNKGFFLLLAGLGTFISVASKGAAGFGTLGGLVLATLLFQYFKLAKVSGKEFFSFLFFSVFIAFLPLALWAFYTHPDSASGIWHFKEYWEQQVFKSFTTNRGSELHQEGGSRLRYFQVILKYGWPWWWTVPAGFYLFFRKRLKVHLRQPVFSLWVFASFCFFLAFFIPFSFSSFQLPHYIHPIYLPLAPIGAFFLCEVLPLSFKEHLKNPRLLWGLVAFSSIFMLSYFRGLSVSSNRGQEFYIASKRLNSVPMECPVLLRESSADPYRMEAFSMWYFRGRSWQRLSSSEFKKASQGEGALWLMEPHKFSSYKEFLFSKNCKPKS